MNTNIIPHNPQNIPQIDFIPGDLVTSDKYGPGRVTAYSKAMDRAVLATFGANQVDNAYDKHTGRRLPRFGSDVITHREVPHATD